MSKDERFNYISIAFHGERKSHLDREKPVWVWPGQAHFWVLCLGLHLTSIRDALPPCAGSVCTWSTGTQARGSTSIFTDQFLKGVCSTFLKYHLIIIHQSEELGRDFSHAETLTFSRSKVKPSLPPSARGFAGDRSGQGCSLMHGFLLFSHEN